MSAESQEQINQRLTQGVASNTASIAVLAEGASTRYKGVKATVAELPASGNYVGDMWYVTANQHGYFWDGTQWNDGNEITKGVSPAVSITEKSYGHDVTITDADHPQGQTFDVRNGVSSSANVVKTAVDATGNKATTITCQTGSAPATTATINCPDIKIVASSASAREAGTIYFVTGS